MDPVPPHFQVPHEEIVRLIGDHPLAWVVTPDGQAQLFPVRPVLDARGALTELSGHFPRASGICRAVAYGGRASFLFQGPSAYVSSSWFVNRRLAPTWASMSVAIVADVTLRDDPAELRRSLTELVDAQEAGRARAWSLGEMGDRYDLLAARIVAFRASIAHVRAAFRLCQDEDDETFSQVVEALGLEGRGDIVRPMRALRPGAPDAAGAEIGKP